MSKVPSFVPASGGLEGQASRVEKWIDAVAREHVIVVKPLHRGRSFGDRESRARRNVRSTHLIWKNVQPCYLGCRPPNCRRMRSSAMVDGAEFPPGRRVLPTRSGQGQGQAEESVERG